MSKEIEQNVTTLENQEAGLVNETIHTASMQVPQAQERYVCPCIDPNVETDEDKIAKQIKQLHPGVFEGLYASCKAWSKVYYQYKSMKNGLTNIVHDTGFKKICETSKQTDKAHPDNHLVEEFLLELARGAHREFLIPYTFLTHSDNIEFSYVHIGIIGCVTKLNELLEPFHHEEL